MMSDRTPDYEGSIMWAHTELDTWHAPRTRGLATLSVSGRIGEICAKNFEEIQSLRAEVARLTAELKSLRRTEHDTCEDCWYSCPKSDEYCGDGDRNRCNCGADRINAIIDAALKAGEE